MIFDQFSRYKACSDLLFQAEFTMDNTVLDVGSGPECLLGEFIPKSDITYVDPLIEDNSDANRIKGNVFSKVLNGQLFDYVTAVDVLEHVPSEKRGVFLNRLSTLSKKALVLGFPTTDASDAVETDKTIESQYSEIFGQDFSWLEEHHQCGLPRLDETIVYLEKLGWHCQTIGHGHAPWLKELLGFTICVLIDPSLKSVIFEISERFNRDFLGYDFCPPYYRNFIVASRRLLPTIHKRKDIKINSDAKIAFRSLIEDAYRLYFRSSLGQINVKNKEILSLNSKIDEVSEWCILQKETLSERDKQITQLQQHLKNTQTAKMEQESLINTLNQCVENEVSKIAKLEKELSDKHIELMKMSDWAYGMMQTLNRINSFLPFRLMRAFLRLLRFLKRLLKKSKFGCMLLYVKDRRKNFKSKSTFEDLRNSVDRNLGKIIVTFPIITWDFRWQRPQQIVSRLRDSGYTVLYLAMTVGVKGRRYRSVLEASTDVGLDLIDRNIYQLWLKSVTALNIYTDQIRGDNLFNVITGLKAVISKANAREIIYFIQFPGWSNVAFDLKKEFGGKIVFDCMDDHGGFSTNTEAALENEEELFSKADLVITSSDILEEKSRKLNNCTIQVKNGTEFEHFCNAQANGKLDHLLGKPIIGYYGAISDWFDMDIIEYCAKLRPHWHFVLIGATTGADIKAIKRMKNVHFLGEKQYKDLPGYLAYFNVCTIPFKITPLTMATNPVKFYEYISSGKPVVSVNLPELIACKEECYLASNKQEFLSQLERALNEKDDKIKTEKRILCAQKNSWDSRVESILNTECFVNDH